MDDCARFHAAERILSCDAFTMIVRDCARHSRGLPQSRSAPATIQATRLRAKSRTVHSLLMVLCFLAISGNPLLAWNDVGHMTVARIAYERLTDAERAAVVAILRHHPHLHELLLKDRPAHVTEDEWIFVRAATWPDNIRPPRAATKVPVASHPIYRFHHPAWHYANFEYRAGQRETTLPSHPLPHHPQSSNPADRTDIIEQLDHSYLIVRGTEREQSEPEVQLGPTEIRAVRMCWLFHLMGDIHQPLHVATLVDERIPSLQHGDEGGNKLAIRIHHGSAPRKLHAFWDDLLGTHAHFDKVAQTAEMLSRDPRLASNRLPEFASHKLAWEFAEESYQLAKESIYQNGHLHYALWSRVESHELHEDDVPALSQQAVDQAHAIAQRRITLAGYRLADRLKFIVSRDGSGSGSHGGVASPIRRTPPSARSILVRVRTI